jgi:hypothetical protein
LKESVFVPCCFSSSPKERRGHEQRSPNFHHAKASEETWGEQGERGKEEGFLSYHML